MFKIISTYTKSNVFKNYDFVQLFYEFQNGTEISELASHLISVLNKNKSNNLDNSQSTPQALIEKYYILYEENEYIKTKYKQECCDETKGIKDTLKEILCVQNWIKELGVKNQNQILEQLTFSLICAKQEFAIDRRNRRKEGSMDSTSSEKKNEAVTTKKNNEAVSTKKYNEAVTTKKYIPEKYSENRKDNLGNLSFKYNWIWLKEVGKLLNQSIQSHNLKKTLWFINTLNTDISIEMSSKGNNPKEVYDNLITLNNDLYKYLSEGRLERQQKSQEHINHKELFKGNTDFFIKRPTIYDFRNSLLKRKKIAVELKYFRLAVPESIRNKYESHTYKLQNYRNNKENLKLFFDDFFEKHKNLKILDDIFKKASPDLNFLIKYEPFFNDKSYKNISINQFQNLVQLYYLIKNNDEFIGNIKKILYRNDEIASQDSEIEDYVNFISGIIEYTFVSKMIDMFDDSLETPNNLIIKIPISLGKLADFKHTYAAVASQLAPGLARDLHAKTTIEPYLPGLEPYLNSFSMYSVSVGALFLLWVGKIDYAFKPLSIVMSAVALTHSSLKFMTHLLASFNPDQHDLPKNHGRYFLLDHSLFRMGSLKMIEEKDDSYKITTHKGKDIPPVAVENDTRHQDIKSLISYSELKYFKAIFDKINETKTFWNLPTKLVATFLVSSNVFFDLSDVILSKNFNSKYDDYFKLIESIITLVALFERGALSLYSLADKENTHIDNFHYQQLIMHTKMLNQLSKLWVDSREKNEMSTKNNYLSYSFDRELERYIKDFSFYLNCNKSEQHYSLTAESNKFLDQLQIRDHYMSLKKIVVNSKKNIDELDENQKNQLEKVKKVFIDYVNDEKFRGKYSEFCLKLESEKNGSLKTFCDLVDSRIEDFLVFENKETFFELLKTSLQKDLDYKKKLGEDFCEMTPNLQKDLDYKKKLGEDFCEMTLNLQKYNYLTDKILFFDEKQLELCFKLFKNIEKKKSGDDQSNKHKNLHEELIYYLGFISKPKIDRNVEMRGTNSFDITRGLENSNNIKDPSRPAADSPISTRSSPNGIKRLNAESPMGKSEKSFESISGSENSNYIKDFTRPNGESPILTRNSPKLGAHSEVNRNSLGYTSASLLDNSDRKVHYSSDSVFFKRISSHHSNLNFDGKPGSPVLMRRTISNQSSENGLIGRSASYLSNLSSNGNSGSQISFYDTSVTEGSSSNKSSLDLSDTNPFYELLDLLDFIIDQDDQKNISEKVCGLRGKEGFKDIYINFLVSLSINKEAGGKVFDNLINDSENYKLKGEDKLDFLKTITDLKKFSYYGDNFHSLVKKHPELFNKIKDVTELLPLQWMNPSKTITTVLSLLRNQKFLIELGEIKNTINEFRKKLHTDDPSKLSKSFKEAPFCHRLEDLCYLKIEETFNIKDFFLLGINDDLFQIILAAYTTPGLPRSSDFFGLFTINEFFAFNSKTALDSPFSKGGRKCPGHGKIVQKLFHDSFNSLIKMNQVQTFSIDSKKVQCRFKVIKIDTDSKFLGNDSSFDGSNHSSLKEDKSNLSSRSDGSSSIELPENMPKLTLDKTPDDYKNFSKKSKKRLKYDISDFPKIDNEPKIYFFELKNDTTSLAFHKYGEDYIFYDEVFKEKAVCEEIYGGYKSIEEKVNALKVEQNIFVDNEDKIIYKKEIDGKMNQLTCKKNVYDNEQKRFIEDTSFYLLEIFKKDKRDELEFSICSENEIDLLELEVLFQNNPEDLADLVFPSNTTAMSSFSDENLDNNLFFDKKRDSHGNNFLFYRQRDEILKYINGRINEQFTRNEMLDRVKKVAK